MRVETTGRPRIRLFREYRCVGSAGATLGLLLPKHPLCWMALTGSLTTGSVIMKGAEVVGVAFFRFAFWKMTRGCGMTV
jgi:hypothetical protein